MNRNIPDGYDCNGVRNGNGIWYEEGEWYSESDYEKGLGEIEKPVDKYEALRNAESGYFVECLLCGRMINARNAEKYCAGYLCELCAESL